MYPLRLPRRTPLEVQAASYLAASVRMVSFSNTSMAKSSLENNEYMFDYKYNQWSGESQGGSNPAGVEKIFHLVGEKEKQSLALTGRL